jgi:hypothetical protein
LSRAWASLQSKPISWLPCAKLLPRLIESSWMRPVIGATSAVSLSGEISTRTTPGLIAVPCAGGASAGGAV